MKILSCILIGSIPFHHGFQLPSPRTILNEISSLENIVNTKAVVSTLTSRTNTEIINDNILFEPLLVPGSFHANTDMFYITILLVSWYGRISTVKDESKLGNIKTYSNTRKLTNIMFLVSMFILTKNVESAT